jgi:hypothetical protein
MHEIGETLEEEQRKACAQYGAPWEPAPAHFKVGASPNVRTGIVLVNGASTPTDSRHNRMVLVGRRGRSIV